MTSCSPSGHGCTLPSEADSRATYRCKVYQLAAGKGMLRATLGPLQAGDAAKLGTVFAEMPPWASYRIEAPRLAALLGCCEPGAVRLAIRVDGELAGAVIVREPWLLGPYLQFLGLLPERQGMGLGKAVLDWMACEGPPRTRNLWLCVTAGNSRARDFYERAGFAAAGTLPDLVSDGMDEILMRRRLEPRH